MSNRNHLCDFCGQAFIRAEHLSRHRRIHTQEKPYKCGHCNECFSRTDLRSRHISIAHRDRLSQPDEQSVQETGSYENGQVNARKRPRTKVACTYCNLHKLKCSIGRPCDRCRAKNLICTSYQLQSSQDDGSHDTNNPLDTSIEPQIGEFHSINWSNAGCQNHLLPQPVPHGHQPPRGLVSFFTQGLLAPTSLIQSDGDLFPGATDSGTINSLLREIDTTYEFGQLSSASDDIINLGSADELFQCDVHGNPLFAPPESTPDSRGLTPGLSLSPQELEDLFPSPETFLKENGDWFSTLKIEQDSESSSFDRDMLDKLLWLFRDCAAPWLSAFRNREIVIMGDTRKEWYLAMASVGALYCSVDGTWAVARWLHHCARQSLLSFTHALECSTISEPDNVVTLETYILLELFGYLSGDQGALELTEAIHSSMFQVARDLKLFKTDCSLNADQQQRLVETLHLCDCYRVVIVQHSPGSIGIRDQSSMDQEIYASFLSTLKTWTTRGELAESFRSSRESLHALCILSLFTWVTLPSSQHPPGFRIPSLWSRTFCELALNQWVNAHNTPPDCNSYILFHAIHINILVNVAALRTAVKVWLYGSTNPLLKDRITPADRIFISEERTKAIWHARQIVHRAFALKHVQSRDDLSTARSQAPHFSYCVYLAGLVLWYNSLLEEGKTAARKWIRVVLVALQSTQTSPVPVNRLYRPIFENLITGDAD